MGTERISSFQSSPATSFALHCDIVSTEPSYGEHGRWRVRMELQAANGPGGTTGSAFLGPGTQSGQRARDGGGYTTVLSHSGNPFLPPGYANGQTRWVDAQEFYLVANANGYWSGSLTSITLRMPLAYGNVNVTPSGSMPIPRIPRAPGKPGKPTVSNLTKNSARFSWGAAQRGNANIQDYGVYVSTSPTFNTHTFQDWVGTGTSFQLGNILQPNTTYYVRVRARNADGTGAYSDVTSFTTLPDAPTAPVIGTPERVSDTQHTVKWTRKASTAAPYTQQQVQRRTHDGAWGEWTGVATLGTTRTNEAAESWTDNGTVPNRAYQYRIKASNAAGDATSDASVVVYTTPGAPSSLVAEKTADNKVKLTIAQTVPHTAYETELEYSTDGGDNWNTLDTVAAGVLTYTWDNPVLTDPLTFRARVVIDTNTGVGDGLASTWRASNTIQLAAPPNAPSALNPNGVAFDGGQARVFTWQHNPVDTSPQSQYQIRYREQGAGSWTTLSAVASDVSAHEFVAATFENGKSYEWAVRTWGIHEDPSPWSATATFNATTPPVATITSPQVTHDTSQLQAAWTYYDEESTAQAAWQAELVRGGSVIEQRSGSGAATSTTFQTLLTDATTYTVRVRVQDGSGLWSAWDEVTFTTEFDTPPQPLVALQWDENEGCVHVIVGNPEAGSDEVEATRNAVYRSLDGGESWELLTDSLDLGGTFTDRTIPLGVEVLYKAVAWSTLPSSIESEVVDMIPPADSVYWSAGPGFATTVRMRDNISGPPRVDLTGGLVTRRLHYFAGRTLPVEAAGTQQAVTGSVSFIVTDRDALATVRALRYVPAPHMIRTPDGLVLHCSIGPVEESRVVGDIYGISFDVQEVEA